MSSLTPTTITILQNNISDTNHFANGTVTARVIYKDVIVPFKNGTGTKFLFEIADSSTTLQCVAFNKDAKKFNDLLKINNIYSIKLSCSINKFTNAFQSIFNEKTGKL